MSGLARLYSPPEIGAPGKRSARARRRDLTLSGLFVLGMGALAVAAFAFLIPGLLGDAYRLTAYFADATGLYVSSQVTQDGYAIGIVERVTPVFPGRDPDAVHCPEPADREDRPRAPQLPCFRATLRIRDGWPIPGDSTVVLGSAGLLQGKAVKILPGAAPEVLADGDRIPSAGHEADLVAQLEDLTASLKDLVDKTIEPALASIRDQVQTIRDLLGTGGEEAANRDRLAGIFGNLKQLSADMEAAVDPGQIRAILAAVEEVTGNLATVSGTLTDRSADVRRTVRKYGELATEIRGLIAQSKPQVQGSLDDTQYLLQTLAASLVPILGNIEEATRNLSALSRDLRTNPGIVIRGRKVEDRTPWLE